MKLHEMQQKRATIAAEMRALNEKIGDASWTEEQRSQWDNAKHEYDKLDAAIKREEELRAMDNILAAENEPEHRNNSEGSEDERRAAVFDKFVRHGLGELSTEEKRTLKEFRAQGIDDGEGGGSKGGFTVPKQFRNRVVEAMKAYGGIAGVCQILSTSNGQDIDWTYSDGTADMGVMLGENEEASEGDVTFESITIGAKKMTSKIIRVSNELLLDSGIDMNGYLAARIAQRLGRGEAAQIVNGDGTGKNVKGLAKWVKKTMTAAAADAFTWEELLTLKHSVDPAYRNSPKFRFAFNDNTLLKISSMKDAQGRPLWLPDVVGMAPATVLNVPYVIDQAIADIGAGKQFVYCGDFDRFILRRVAYMTLMRLTERYAEFDQVGFLAFHRFDCALEDAAAVKALVGKDEAK
ncbi:phage major capsid protein [Cronobacter sakazakii]|nr:phage major capsid protein [Cronobacter sakazakii]KAB1028368.1 phage major capsid protein [Cronobacter sakazakii]MDK1271745.1 phage major capsid protein [Cronobacter sakazakii]